MPPIFRTMLTHLVAAFPVALLLIVPRGVCAGSEMDKKEIEKQWGEAVAGQVIIITSEKRVYAPEERIVLKVFLRNVGPKDVMVLHNTDPLAFNRPRVSFSDGKAVPRTLYGQGRGGDSYATYVAALKPGAELCHYISLSRLFDFSRAGKYTVSVTRHVLKDDGALLATSNVLELTVDDSLAPNRILAD